MEDFDSIAGLQKCYQNFGKIWNQIKDLWMKKNLAVMGAIS